MRVAVIPARGGSKRIPRKNIKNFCGKPMIAWSIDAAAKSDCFDQVIVSTDSEEIADIARELGAIVPFLRPADLSDDFTGTGPVVAHALNWLEETGLSIDLGCCIYATAPFLCPDYIRKGRDVLERTDADYSFSVTSFPFPIQRAVYLDDEGRTKMFEPENLTVRSQDLTEAYHDAGQFYWGRRDAWYNNSTIFSEKSIGVILPRHLVQDIDTPEDWKRAELMFTALQGTDGFK